MLQNFQGGYLKIPSFQRDFVWIKSQILAWSKSIFENDPLGVIVTYQLSTDDPLSSPMYLADGLQRLSATMEIAKNYHEYGFHSEQELAAFLHRFTITVQHKIYSDHGRALIAFHRLNAGTNLEPADYYKGLLTTQCGGEEIYSAIVSVVDDIDKRWTHFQERPNKKATARYRRDALALFYQYVIKATTKQLWNVGSLSIKGSVGGSVEELLGAYISSKPIADVFSEIDVFKRYLDMLAVEINEVLVEYRGHQAKIRIGMFRPLLHYGIYHKNTKMPLRTYQKALGIIFQAAPGLNTQCAYPQGHPNISESLRVDRISKLESIVKAYWPEYEASPKRKRREKLPPGYHHSHYLPFSKYGEGETFPEPALRNMARGAQPVNRNGDDD
jgi:hypothetical protein